MVAYELEDHYDEEDHHDTRDKKMVGPTLCRACVNIRGWLCVGEKKKIYSTIQEKYKTLLWMQDDK